MKKEFTVIEVTIIIAVISLLSAVTIPKILGDRIANNEANAQTVLKTISLALEHYAKGNSGAYPVSLDVLTKSTPPYLNKTYCGAAESGYTYSCILSISGYTITARPRNCKTVGSKSFTLTTGGVITNDAECIASLAG